MIGEITVIPQTEGSGRAVVASAIEQIAAKGLRHEVGAAGTSVEGDLDTILDAVRAVERQLHVLGVERAMIELRLQIEPHPETLEHQVAGLAARAT